MSDEGKKGWTKGPTKPIDMYRKTDVLTANRETILLMLYAGAIRYTKRGIDAQERGDNPERNKCLIRVQEIVTELRSTLNFEVGGEIAQQLDGIYAFLTRNISDALLSPAAENLGTVLKLLTTLNEGWEQAAESLKKERAREAAQDK